MTALTQLFLAATPSLWRKKMQQQPSIFYYLLLSFALLWNSAAYALSESDILPPEKAFVLTLKTQSSTELSFEFEPATGYYLYKNKIEFNSIPPTAITPPTLPTGILQTDPFLGEQYVYHDKVSGTLKINTTEPFTLQVKLQGCAKVGICFPPETRSFEIQANGQYTQPLLTQISSWLSPSESTATPNNDLPNTQATQRQTASGSFTALASSASASTAQTSTSPIQLAEFSSSIHLDRENIFLSILAFYVAGLGLALTACMYPLLPILSSIIAGHSHQLTRKKSLLLSLAYVEGLALSYTAIGVIAGLTGSLISVWLQQPIVILTASVLIVILALGMFDILRIQLPSSVQTHVSDWSNRLPGGQYSSVFMMGVFSSLLIGPCIAPPLAVALAYIGSTSDAFLGGLSLFSLAQGLGTPLILLGLFGGSILPKAGRWMNQIKAFFGVVMLFVALYLAHPFLGPSVTMFLLASILITCSVFLGAFESLASNAHTRAKLAKSLAWLCLLVGALQLIGAFSAGQSVQQPLQNLLLAKANATTATHNSALNFKVISTQAELSQVLQQTQGPLLIDFYANWCIACKELDAYTFSDANIQQVLQNYTLIKVDMSDMTAEHQQMLKDFKLYGPPALLIRPNISQPLNKTIGFISAQELLPKISL